MKLLKLTLITLFSLFIGFSFSSCEENNEYWRATTLDFSVNVPVNNYTGSFATTIRLEDALDIEDYSPAREELLDIHTLDSWLLLTNLKRTDRISFRIAVDGNLFYDQIGISGDNEGEYEIDNDAYYSFMVDVIDRIRARGYVDINIVGNSNIRDGGPIVFDFTNNVDILVRD